jgi:hypothetical protein
MDHNCSPREDVTKYGEAMVKEGKITRSQLATVKRWEGAHANCIEGFAMFGVSVVGLSLVESAYPEEFNRREIILGERAGDHVDGLERPIAEKSIEPS